MDRSGLVRQLVDFVETLEPDNTPFTEELPMPRMKYVPEYCAITKKEPVEPYHAIYQKLWDIMEMITPVIEEDEWGDWQPSDAARMLQRITFEVGRESYKEVDNPEYDEARCLAWKEENMKSWTTFEWGTGFQTPEHSVVVTPDGPRDIDEGVEG